MNNSVNLGINQSIGRTIRNGIINQINKALISSAKGIFMIKVISFTMFVFSVR